MDPPVFGPPPTRLDLEPAAGDREAIALLDESVALSRQLGDPWSVAVALTGGGGLAAHTTASGDFERAIAAATEGLAIYWHLRDLRNVGVVVRQFGRIALGQGEPHRAARLIAAFRRQYESTTGVILPLSVWPGDEPEMAALRARLQMPDDAYAVVWAQGRSMSLEQASAYALRQIDPFGDDAGPVDSASPAAATLPSPRGPEGLTPREREVAILVGRGYSNRRIAEALVIAEKTAEVHARNIREKLGLESRAQIAAWAQRHGLLGTDP
jgi:DNA-binding CsgD family transcriptional regulator